MHAAGIGVPEIRFLTTVTGTADCIAEIVVAAYEDLEWLVPELFPDSAWSTEALPVMRTFTSAHDWSPFGNATGRAGGIGNTVEWVDWAVYSTFSSIFAHHFSPGNEAAAIVIAVTPTFSAIGYFAPVILLIARLAQGFSAGGEFGSSSAFMVESAAPQRRAFAGSWQQVSVGAGGLIASGMGYLITTLLPESVVDGWGWRIAFFVGALLGLVGLWLRVSVEETASFTAVESARPHRPPTNPFAMFTKHSLATLRVFGITIAGTLLYYMWVSFMPTFAHISTGMPLSQTLLANVISLIIFVILLPFAGLLSDLIGRKVTLTAFAGGFLIFSWPAFLLLDGNFWTLLVIEVIGMVLLLGYSGNCAVIMAEQFPPEVRAAGIGFPYALAVAIFGGTAPYITTWFTENKHGDLVWIYCAAAAAIGLIVYLTMPETKGKELT